MTSFSLATISKGNNVQGVGFYPSFGMLRTAIFMPFMPIHIGEVVDWIKDKFLVTKASTLQCSIIATKW